MDDPIEAVYSVSFRLQRTTTETAFVRVPLTIDLKLELPDGTSRINTDKLMARAVEYGSDAGVNWQAEDQSIQLHPMQIAPPRG